MKVRLVRRLNLESTIDCGASKRSPSERRAAKILFGITVLEGGWVAANWIRHGARFFWYLGFVHGRSGTWWGWLTAIIVAVLYVGYCLRFPSVRDNLFRRSRLKGLALAAAVTAAILEEVMFRKWIMDSAHGHGFGPFGQIAISSFTFGLLHGAWGLMGPSLRVAIGATVATGALGSALAIVYLLSGRSLAPCITAHFLVNALIEPGMVLAATRGEMAAGADPGR